MEELSSFRTENQLATMPHIGLKEEEKGEHKKFYNYEIYYNTGVDWDGVRYDWYCLNGLHNIYTVIDVYREELDYHVEEIQKSVSEYLIPALKLCKFPMKRITPTQKLISK